MVTKQYTMYYYLQVHNDVQFVPHVLTDFPRLPGNTFGMGMNPG